MKKNNLTASLKIYWERSGYLILNMQPSHLQGEVYFAFHIFQGVSFQQRSQIRLKEQM